MRIRTLLVFIAIIISSLPSAASGPKREFRGAWLNTIWQDGYRTRTTEQNKKWLTGQLDRLHAAGVNVVIFQVRPQADAFYNSRLELWSRFLTDGGAAPKPFWDPLEFMVSECHKRGMELHAWLNPYRVTSSAKQTLPAGHLYHKHPERFVRYDGKLYFDPGRPENRDFIGKVVDDIVERYDIDGIHFDDYFYPYPVKGKRFIDDKSYARYGKGMKLADWRRKNVDLLIEEVHKRIAAKKPWVRFGISPFGIWRNKKTDSRGSETSGLQNYDDLYADVLLWDKKGWVDYLLPQIYWNFENKSAPYKVLVEWWNENAGTNRHLYIGQDIDRTVKATSPQLFNKVEMTRKAGNISGNCWWPGYSLTANKGGVADSLSTYLQCTPALVPDYPWISNRMPAPVDGLKVSKRRITWNAVRQNNTADDVTRFVIYRFKTVDDIDIENSDAIEAIVGTTSFTAENPGVYVITALSRVNNESEPSNPIVVK